MLTERAILTPFSRVENSHSCDALSSTLPRLMKHMHLFTLIHILKACSRLPKSLKMLGSLEVKGQGAFGSFVLQQETGWYFCRVFLVLNVTLSRWLFQMTTTAYILNPETDVLKVLD